VLVVDEVKLWGIGGMIVNRMVKKNFYVEWATDVHTILIEVFGLLLNFRV